MARGATATQQSAKTNKNSSENSRITLGGVAGTISLLVDASTMAALTANQYVYDLELISSAGIVTRLVQGTFIVDPEVTR